MMKIFNRILVFLISGLLISLGAAAQNAIAVSSDPGLNLHVALNWQPAANAKAYNIYRREVMDSVYPVNPLNPIPVKILTNCSAIKSLLIPTADSIEWKMVASSLADSVLFDPCKISQLFHTSEKYNRLLTLSKINMRIAMAAGLGYEDHSVSLNKEYFYKIVAVNGSNVPISTIASDLKVKAGSFTPFPAPTGVIAEAGDAMVEVRWKRVAGAAGYVLERSTSIFPATFQRVNNTRFPTQVKNRLNGDTLIPTAQGIIDFQHYDSASGRPVAHLVNGLFINGPKDGTTYYYRVSSLDFFDRAGLPSAISNPVMPKDTIKPSVPIDLSATPNDINGSVNIRWTQVVKDINGHWEAPDSSLRYRIYRFNSSDDPNTHPSTLVGEVSTLKGQRSKDTTDSDPNLRGTFGNRTWWYRIRAIDVAGNISQYSSAISAIVKDTTPPAIVTGVSAKGLETYISVKWKPNTEPDVASYMIYRSLCHLGSWVLCNPKDTCNQWSNYDPNNPKGGDTRPNRLPCPCSGSFVFLGEVTQDSAKRAMTAGNFFFDDRTIPAGSPLCYAYWIKAKDSSDNISGSFPIPSAAERTQIVCQRLHDLTPPEPAIISGLFAQADQVRVEWMGPPTQDTRAYHVYRALGNNPATEPPVSAYSWVGGMTIELPPTLPKVLTTPYKPANIAACDKISVQATPWMSQGFFEDKKIKPKLTYWYRVVGIDYDGNETPLSKAAAISTFSFTRRTVPAPVVDSITSLTDSCGVVLHWSPVFNSTLHLGFIIYRGSSSAGPFTPVVVSPVNGNSFTDTHVVRGITYWYRLAVLMKNGRLSDLTAPQSFTP